MSKLNELVITHNVKVGEIEKLQNKVDVINSCYDNFAMISCNYEEDAPLYDGLEELLKPYESKIIVLRKELETLKSEIRQLQLETQGWTTLL